MADPEHRRWVKTVVAGNPGPLTLDGTCTYVLGPAPCIVIDPGPDLATHIEAVQLAVGVHEVAAICVTHHHPDHAAGARDLADRLGAPLAATLETARSAGLATPDLQLSESAILEFGGGRLEVIPAPGHSKDHICYHWPESRALFAGDVIMGEGTSMIAPPEGDMAAYLSTLERLARLDLSVIYPGHGEPVTDPAAKVSEYLAHRLERERQVLGALAAGADSLSAVRALVYRDLNPDLHRAAEGSVLAHLAKLVDEGRVLADGERYRLTGRVVIDPKP